MERAWTTWICHHRRGNAGDAVAASVRGKGGPLAWTDVRSHLKINLFIYLLKSVRKHYRATFHHWEERPVALLDKRFAAFPDARRSRLSSPILQRRNGMERWQFLLKPYGDLKKYLIFLQRLWLKENVDLLDFTTPRGCRLHTASFSTELLTAAATLSALPILEGSMAYTYTSKPLKGVQGTSSSALLDLVQRFRDIPMPKAPDEAKHWEIWQGGRRVDFRGNSLLFKC